MSSTSYDFHSADYHNRYRLEKAKAMSVVRLTWQRNAILKKEKRWQHLYLNFLTSNWLSLALSLSHTFWVNINNIFWMAKLEAKNLRWTVPKKLSSSEKLTFQIKYLWKISLPGMKNIEIIYLEKNGNTSQSLFLHLVKSTICRNCEGGVRLKPFK